MKIRIPLVFGLLMLPLISAKAQWRLEQPPTINVSGSAEVKVAPDEVDLNVGVETRDENLETAKQKNDEHVAGALEFLKHNQVKDKEVQTDYITIEPVYDPDASISRRASMPGNSRYNALTKPIYYTVRKSIGIKLTNVDGFDAIMTGLITNGVNSVQGIDFRTSELRKYKDQARAMAIKAAKEKAEAMAAALGVKVGKPYNISVNDWGGWYSPSRSGWGYGGGGGAQFQNAARNAGGDSGENGATLAVGQISISANVSVSFLIQ